MIMLWIVFAVKNYCLVLALFWLSHFFSPILIAPGPVCGWSLPHGGRPSLSEYSCMDKVSETLATTSLILLHPFLLPSFLLFRPVLLHVCLSAFISVGRSLYHYFTHALSISPFIYSSFPFTLFLFLFLFVFLVVLLLLLLSSFHLSVFLSFLHLISLTRPFSFDFLFFPGKLMNGSACIKGRKHFPLSHRCLFITRRCMLQVCTSGISSLIIIPSN